MLAMHAIGYALSQALGYSYADFKKDDFTVNEAHYYMFNKVRASSTRGVLEVGELTCPQVEKRLIESADRIAANLSKAIEFVLSTK